MAFNKSVIVMGVLAVIATALAWRKGGEFALQGLKDGGALFLSILPSLALGFVLAGMVGVLIPKETIIKWLGTGSGFYGLAAGTVLGAVTPGGPFAQFPLVASLWKMGAGPGPLAAYLTSWSLLGVNRVIVYEWPFMGPTFTTVHLAVCFFAPPLIGLVVSQVFKHLV